VKDSLRDIGHGNGIAVHRLLHVCSARLVSFSVAIEQENQALNVVYNASDIQGD